MECGQNQDLKLRLTSFWHDRKIFRVTSWFWGFSFGLFFKRGGVAGCPRGAGPGRNAGVQPAGGGSLTAAAGRRPRGGRGGAGGCSSRLRGSRPGACSAGSSVPAACSQALWRRALWLCPVAERSVTRKGTGGELYVQHLGTPWCYPKALSRSLVFSDRNMPVSYNPFC